MSQPFDLLADHFFARVDCVAVLAPWGKPCPVDAIARLEQLIEAHLRGDEAPVVRVHRLQGGHPGDLLTGRFRLGSYVPDHDGNTAWLCIDVDGPGHAHAVADAQQAILAIREAFGAHGLTVYLEKSGGGQGWHLWVFFTGSVSAQKARQLALGLIPKDIPLADGGSADPSCNRGVEVFPKQTTIAEDGFGNMVWLPWWYGAVEGANQFHSVNGDGTLHPCMPESLEAVDEAYVDRVLSQLEPRDQTRASSKPRQHSPVAHTADDPWRDWRARALTALDLEKIYGTWLTGKQEANGWLECRVPWSPTGDRHPSGGVADGSGQAERGAFHDFTSGETLSVFDLLVRVGEATDFADACKIIGRLTGVALPVGSVHSVETLPRIQVNNRQLRDVVTDTWQAIDLANGGTPSLFTRNGNLVHVAEKDGRLGIERHNEASITGHMARVADWVRITANGSTSVSPSKDVARDLLAYPDAQLPALEAIVKTPVFTASGRLLLADDYYPEERLLLARSSSCNLPSIPENPTADDVASARELLCEDLLGDFPFVDRADNAHAVAAISLPVVRRMIEGVTPLHVVSAPMAGSGKGLLCDVVSIIAEGRSCEAQPISGNEEEIRKVITAQLSRAHSIILLDNARERRRLDSPSLAAALTTTAWADRILKESQIISLPNRAVWLLTGNNPQFSMELARRSIRIRIDPEMDQPWRRTGFRHQNLRAWTTEHRAELLAALFILVRAWQAAGRPLRQIELGTFEHWSQIIGGILSVAGIPGFLANLDDFYDTSDAESQAWREFVISWSQHLDSEPKRIRELNAFCNERDLLASVRGSKTDRSQETRLGLALQSVQDRVFAGHKIVLDRNSHGRGKTYRLVPISGEVSGAV